jgi:uncharacterized protein YbbK (DUF523 family)/uncharacterized protein YbgA (DUF1722 family)
MNMFPKPVVVVSACLEFENVRYDGQVIPCKIVRDLEPYVEYIKVCPEVAIGLGVPRDPIRIVKLGNKKRLIQPKTKEDITDKMNAYTTGFIKSLPDVDGFIFKSKSPTIGLRGIKVYGGIENASVIERGSGFFADQILHAYPGYPMEEDDRLRNETIRHNFLVKLFTFADLRRTRQKESIEALQEFHQKNRFLFMSYSAEYLAELATLVKNEAENDTATVLEDYFTVLKKLFSLQPSAQSRLNAVQQMFGSFSKNLSQKERTFFDGVIEDYQQNKICLLCLLNMLKSYALRFEDKYIETQTFLEPYPKELMVTVEQDRERDYWKAEH